MKKEESGKYCFRPAKTPAMLVLLAFLMFALSGFSVYSKSNGVKGYLVISGLSVALGILFYVLISEMLKTTIEGNEIRIRRFWFWKKAYCMGDVKRAVFKVSAQSMTLYFNDGKKVSGLTGGKEHCRRLIDSLYSKGIEVTEPNGMLIPRSVWIQGDAREAGDAREFSFLAGQELEKAMGEIAGLYRMEGIELVTGMLNRTESRKQEGWSLAVRFKKDGRYMAIGGKSVQMLLTLSVKTRKQQTQCFTNYMEIYNNYWRIFLLNSLKEIKTIKRFKLLEGEPQEQLIPTGGNYSLPEPNYDMIRTEDDKK